MSGDAASIRKIALAAPPTTPTLRVRASVASGFPAGSAGHGRLRTDRLRPEGLGSGASYQSAVRHDRGRWPRQGRRAGEVSAGLPLALRRRGIDIRILMPAYQEVIDKLRHVQWVGELPGRAGIPAARLGMARLADGMILYLVAAPSLFDRRGTPVLHAGRVGLAGQPPAFRLAFAGGGGHRGGARRAGLGAGHCACERLAGRFRPRPICAGTAPISRRC